MAALLVAIGAYQRDRRNRWLVLLGVSLGCPILNRENARLLFPLLAAWLVVGNRDLSLRRRLRTVAVFTLAVILPVAPVAIRNYYVAGEVLISTSQFGPNFYIGNRQGASGVYDPLVAGRASVIYEQDDAVRLATEAIGRPLSPSEVSSAGQPERGPAARTIESRNAHAAWRSARASREARRCAQGVLRALSLNTTNPMDLVGLKVRIASLDASEGRIDEALSGLRHGRCSARSSGQFAMAAEVDATIEALRRRTNPK